MHESRSSIIALIIVVLAALATALLLLVALLIWLSEWFGSIVIPALILSGFTALLAFVVYKVSLQSAMREMHERMEVIYDVTRSLHEFVSWAVRLLYRKME